MKKTGIIMCIAMVLVMLTASVCFGAEDFKIEQTYPSKGAKNTTKENMCLKIYFNSEVGNKASRQANENCYSIKDSKGKEYPSRIYYNDKNPKYVLLVIDTNKIKPNSKNGIKDDTVYVAEISKDFVNNNGVKLGDDAERIIEFRTMNQGRNTMIYMVMMALMFGGMMFFTMRQARRSEEKESQEKGEAAFNPYKESKRTGKSVKQVIEEHRAEEEKKAKHTSKRNNKKNNQSGVQSDLQDDEENFRVPRPRPISEAGSTYKTGRAAEAEKRRQEAAAHKAELKATNYGKNPEAANKRKKSGKYQPGNKR